MRCDERFLNSGRGAIGSTVKLSAKGASEPRLPGSQCLSFVCFRLHAHLIDDADFMGNLAMFLKELMVSCEARNAGPGLAGTC